MRRSVCVQNTKYFARRARDGFVCTETHELGEETIASYLYQVHLYHWLESNGHGRYLADQDL